MQRWFRLSPDELRELNAELVGVLGVLDLPQLPVVALLSGTCAGFFRTAYAALVPQSPP